MDSERLEQMELNLKEGLHAIEILTERLINLAVIENRFIKKADDLERLEIICQGIYYQTQKTEERINKSLEESREFFKFRFRWMEQLFMKVRRWW